MGAQKVLWETDGLRFVIGALNKAGFDRSDTRWKVQETREHSLRLADELIPAGPYKQLLLDFMPHTAGALCSDVDKMKEIARKCTVKFPSAFAFECIDAQRKAFAQECLDGFCNPASTTLRLQFGHTENASLRQRDELHQWFVSHFVEATDIMCVYEYQYEFQFRCYRNLATKLVECDGNIQLLKEQVGFCAHLFHSTPK